MRDPERIDRVIEKVRAYWKKYPDQRLGQLIMNVDRGEAGWPDIWEVEDDTFEQKIDKELQR